MKYLQLLLVIFTVGAVLALLYLQSSQYLLLREREVRNLGIDGCLQATRYSFKENEATTVTVPVDTLYRECLKLKQIQ